jgi:hypothetical protein
MKKPLKSKPSARKTPAKRTAQLGTKTPASAKPAPANTKPPINVSALARQHGISRETIRVWKNEGVDISDEKAVADRVSKMPGRDPSTTVGEGESYCEARTRRMSADADRAEFQAKQQAGELVSLAAVEDAMQQLGSEMRSRLLGWSGILPPMLEGLDAARIQAILRTKITELLTQIHENSPLGKV